MRYYYKRMSSFDFGHNFLRLFQSYIIGQKQFVKIDEFFSGEIAVTQRVTHCSLLGPLLFIVFANCVAISVKHSYSFLYFDDLLLASVFSMGKIDNDRNNLSCGQS